MVIVKEPQFIPSELTFPITIEADGFNQDSDEWDVTCVVGRKATKCSTIRNSQGNWFFLLETAELKSGICHVVVEYDIPDVAYPDNLRHVVWKHELCLLKDV